METITLGDSCHLFLKWITFEVTYFVEYHDTGTSYKFKKKTSVLKLIIVLIFARN
jgi:hypothetical protein